MSHYNIENSTNFSHNTNSFNVQNTYVLADDRSQLLNWLSPLDSRLLHRDIQGRRVHNVGEWLLRTEEFRSWSEWSEEGEGDKAVLFCYGGPGVGKTFISSLVVDRLSDRAKGQNTAVTCFYIDFAARKEQSVASILGSLLRQAVGRMEKVPKEISGAFQEQKSVIGGRGPRLPDIVKMLQTVTSSLPTFICIDALDECSTANRVKLLNSLKKILEKSSRTRIFIIGRPQVRAEIERCFAGRVISVSVSPRKDDIIEYLRLRLDEDETPDAMDRSLEADILEQIPENMSEMFLLVSLNTDAILHESTISRRLEKLSKMTGGLELRDVYDATIERIKAQDGDRSRLGVAALMWISHAERPLRVDELCYALAVQLGSTDFDAGNIPSMSTLVSCCQGLITVDKEASTVRLIHFTLQEHLSTHPVIFSGPHSAMAEICLTYLNSKQIKVLSTDRSPDTRNAPFLEYCSVYWGVHARRELSDSTKSLALEVLTAPYNQISTRLLLEQVKHLYPWRFNTLSPFSGLHCASFFGIVEVVASLIEMECYDVDGEDFLGGGPLAWAACNGHEELVKLLLGRDEVNPNKPDKSGQTPLSLAAQNGQEGVVKILLEQDGVNPNKPDKSGQRPLSLAAQNGHEEVVKILLGRDKVNPNNPDKSGRTPLLLAARDGRKGVVKILLRRDEVNPNYPDKSGQTPLSHAAQNGHEGVVKILLEREKVNPDKPDESGRTPLTFAAQNGRKGVVKILLRREEVSPVKLDGRGRTPLSYAARNGHEGVVKILLARKEVNPNTPDNSGRTPLSYAAQDGCKGVVKMLLGREKVNPDRQDHDGRTPLSYAAQDGRKGVVKILLGREKVDPDKPDNGDRTPLSFAAEYGHEGVVKALLEREEVNPDKPDDDGRTPLSFAAWYGHEGVVEVLLGQEGVNPDKPDNGGQTPLSFAALYGREGVVEILLGREEVNPNRRDKDRKTPLSYAAWFGHERVVALLRKA